MFSRNSQVINMELSLFPGYDIFLLFSVNMNPLRARCWRYIWFFLICLLCHLSHGSDMRMASFLVPLHKFCSLHSSSGLHFSASTRVPPSIITAVLPFYPNTGSWVNDFKFGNLPSVMAVFCFYGGTL